MEQNQNLTNTIMSIARGIKRRASHQEHHFSRLDSLRLLLKNSDGATSRELAGIMDVRQPTLSEWLDKLTESEEITRVQDEQDKRVFRIYLTQKGKEAAAAVAQKINQSTSLFDGCFTPDEEEQFLHLCKKLQDYLDSIEPRQHHHHHYHSNMGEPKYRGSEYKSWVNGQPQHPDGEPRNRGDAPEGWGEGKNWNNGPRNWGKGPKNWGGEAHRREGQPQDRGGDAFRRGDRRDEEEEI